jgi:hypothetical protein
MRLLIALLCVGVLNCVGVAAEELPSIFNGKDLSGWKVPAENPWWRVENGVLIGESDPKLRGSMLYTEKQYKDVVVEGEFRFDGEIDSGFMLRKPEIQIQIGVSRKLKKDMTASVYAHGGYPGEAKGVEQLLKPGEWNTMRIEAKGETFKTYLNGKHVLTYTDPKFPGAGPIGLQVHGNVKMKVEFRNLRAKEI